MKEITSFLKEKGFVFAGSEIYGGFANSWDYGPLGTLLKNNLKQQWNKFFIDYQENSYYFDSGIFLNSQVWSASGHLKKFNDLITSCKYCKTDYRVDKLITDYETNAKIRENVLKYLPNISCPNCQKKGFSTTKEFNLMYKTLASKLDDSEFIYLRPETAQGIFINFKNLLDSMNLILPFAIGQIGKAFRNEVTPGNFIFRTREFEQLELEVFTEPKQAEEIFKTYLEKIVLFLKQLGLTERVVRQVSIKKADLAHYSIRSVDFEYKFPFGWGELLGIANRGDYDLSNHERASKVNLKYLDSKTNQAFHPYIVETSIGVDRLFLAVICNSYQIEQLADKGTRRLLKLPYKLAPYKLAILPLSSQLNTQAKQLYFDLIKLDIGPLIYADKGSIGKRYRKQDEIGTYFSLTYDFETEKTKTITIRNRDTMKQERILITEIDSYIKQNAK